MRICHFSDSHLGAGETHHRRAESGLTERQEDVINGFIRTVDRIIELKPDLCIHSGDLFHKVRPFNSIMAVAGKQLYRLAEENSIPTIIIAGNHDAPRQAHVGAAIEVYRQIDNLYVAARGELEIFEIGGGRVFALPHCLTTTSLKTQLADCIPDTSADFNILILHGVAAGMPEFSMADLGEQEIPLDIMAPFDYTALGHYHNHRVVGDRAAYAGSSERLSQAERDEPKGFVEVTLDPFDLTFHEVDSRQMVDIQPIDASGLRGDQVTDAIRKKLDEIGSADKIVRVTVTGVNAETLKTMPSGSLADLKQSSYALDVRFEKAESETSSVEFGRSAIGRLDQGFIEYLQSVDLSGFDLELLKEQAIHYLTGDE